MTPWVAFLSAAWVALVVATAAAHRPRGTRLPYREAIRTAGSLGSSVGAALRKTIGRGVDPGLDPIVGRAFLGFIGGTVVDLRLGVALAIAALVAPILGKRRYHRNWEAAVVSELPEVIDLLRLALSGRGSILNAVVSVGELPVGPVSMAFSTVGPEVDRGQRVGDVLTRLGDQLGDHTRSLIRSLVGSDHYGTELGSTLERLAEEAREIRRRRAQTEARRVPIRMLMPLVLGILPAFILLTVVPTLVSTFAGLDL